MLVAPRASFRLRISEAVRPSEIGSSPAKRLVVEDQRRVQRDRAGQCHAARHAARDLRRHQVACAAQADGVELHQHQVADQQIRQFGVLAQRKGHVVEHRHVGEQRAELEQHAHLPARGVERGLVHRADVRAVHAHGAGSRGDLPADQAQHGGLAAAGAAHDGNHAALGHTHAQSGQDASRARLVGEIDLVEFDNGGRGLGRHDRFRR